MSTDIAQRTPQQQLVAQVRDERFKEQVALALPPTITPERFVRATVTALLQNPDIAKADHQSVIHSVIRCAQDGLIPDGKEAALVLFGNKATYMPMIGGYRKIAADHGWTLRTQVVYANDEFDYDLGLDVRLTHKPARPGVDRGPVIAAYAIASHKDGRRELKVMPVEDIEKARAVSRAKDRGPWVDWYPSMCEKTVGRALFAELPLGALDEDRQRLARFMAEAETDPDVGRTALYGPPADSGQPHHAVPGPVAGQIDDDGYVHTGEIIDHAPATGTFDDHSPPSEPAAASAFQPPASAGVDPAITLAAQQAGTLTWPGKKYPGLTLAEVAEIDMGAIKWLLANARDEPLYTGIRAFTRVYAPDIYQAALAAEALA